jgi:hypothetical protein
MARGTEGLTHVGEDLITGEVEASAGIALSNTHRFHSLRLDSSFVCRKSHAWGGAEPPLTSISDQLSDKSHL